MTFLELSPLYALPLAALPVVIHLIHLYRRKQVRWAAMMFLFTAQQMHKGLSRLHRIAILCLRVLAVFAILCAIARPLAGGWLGLTGGAPDTVLVLLDRSASMEEVHPSTGVSKRLAAVRNVSKAIEDAVGRRSKVVLIESGHGKPLLLEHAGAMTDLVETAATDAAADIPGMLQGALDYVTTNKTGRTDVWLVEDLQRSAWAQESGRWEALRGAFAALPGVRFHVLTYPQVPEEDLGVRVERVAQRRSGEKAELLLDLRVARRGAGAGPLEVPLRLVVNGVATTSKVTIQESELLLQAFPVAVDRSTVRGWGRVELPADAFPANDVFHFVFDEQPVLASVVVSDDEAEAAPLAAALSAPAEPHQKYRCSVLPVKRAAEIAWEQTGLLVWHAPIPAREEAIHAQMKEHLAQGRAILFLPPANPGAAEFAGLSWGAWETLDPPAGPDWWRNDTGLLANTRDGTALAVGGLEVSRLCKVGGAGIPLARLPGGGALLMRAAEQPAYFLATLCGAGSSSFARDGVAMFAMLHRALQEGAGTLGAAQQRIASADALARGGEGWRPADERAVPAGEMVLKAGVLASGKQLVALNRPASEDDFSTVSPAVLKECFAGLNVQILSDAMEEGGSLTSEVWRTFLVAMALALVGEALLCLPPRRAASPLERGAAGAFAVHFSKS